VTDRFTLAFSLTFTLLVYSVALAAVGGLS